VLFLGLIGLRICGRITGGEFSGASPLGGGVGGPGGLAGEVPPGAGGAQGGTSGTPPGAPGLDFEVPTLHLLSFVEFLDRSFYRRTDLTISCPVLEETSCPCFISNFWNKGSLNLS